MKKLNTLILYLSFAFSSFAQSYTILGSGSNAIYPNCYISAIATDRLGNLYAACGNTGSGTGYGFVEKWNGTTWTQAGTSTDSLDGNGIVRAIAIDSANNVFVGGDFNDQLTYSIGGDYVAEWNGSTWSEVNNTSNPHVNNANIFSLTIDPVGNLYATEYYENFSGSSYPYLEEWNGSNWTEVGASAPFHPDSLILSLAHDESGNIYAAGEFTDANNYQYVSKWNGSAWSELGTGSSALKANNFIQSVTTDTYGNVYAAGYFSNASSQLYVAKWDGTSWSDLGNSGATLNAPADSNNITSLATDASGNVYVAGWLKDSQGYYVAKWNGSAWTKLHTDTVWFSSLTVDPSGNVYGGKSGIFYIGQLAGGFVARLNFSPVNDVSSISNEPQIRLYPNPTNNSLHIVCDEAVTSVSLYDMLGASVYPEEGDTKDINIASLASGIYSLLIQTQSGKTAVAKFCKQ